ncbi:hypothetical protein [Catellatospora chokoriensis]|uniref:Lipoprotein n=1 Tax=Catellatospora chokoriensis TaxID=310353 RepID=A0A8J3JZR5_9ACTN|nr:hypothetical protein [Catellatospora chokoriensis]GIF94052.1 hypothetical protein Cch02nite_74960 [Catellatospora chokoriensis]
MKDRRQAAGKRAALVALLTTVALALGGCGAPEFDYVKNADDGVYFKVPHGWQRIEHEAMDVMLSGEDPDSVAAAARRERIWSVGYDASVVPQPLHLFLGTGDQPFVYAMVRRLSENEINAVSLNGARDLLLPVTDSARADNAQSAVFQGFELVSDEILPSDGSVRGVRSVFNYSPGGGSLQTFDQTVYVDDAGRRLYQFILRCSASCYRERAAELDVVVQSFTVRSVA